MLFVEVDERLGVAGCPKLMAIMLESLAEPVVIVELTVENDPD
jgi:hypothetical protein